MSPPVTPWSPTLAEFLAAPIRVRPEARAARIESLPVLSRVRTALTRAGLRRIGDLEGRCGVDLNWLPGIGSPQLRDLHRALVERGALRPGRPGWMPPPGTTPPRQAPRSLSTRSTTAHGGPYEPRTLSSETEYAAAGPFHVARILIRPAKRDILFERLPLSNWLRWTLQLHRIRRFGDLEGRLVGDLRKLRRFGRVQLRELHGALVAHDALEGDRIPAIAGAPTLRALHALLPHPRIRWLLEHAPPYWRVRSQTISIRAAARAIPLEELPLTVPLRKTVIRRGRRTLGDLSGLTYDDLAGRQSRGSVVRQLYSLLHAADVCTPPPDLPAVPRRLRDVLVVDVDMSAALLARLRQLRIQRLGQLSSVSPQQLAGTFNARSGQAFLALLQQLQALHVDASPPATAMDRALATLPAKTRRGLLLRFGARDRPLTLRGVLRELGLPVALDRARPERSWIAHLRAAMGPGPRRQLRELAAETSMRAVMPAEEVARRLRIRKSTPRYQCEFYVRLARALEPRLRVKVKWEKRGYGVRRRGESRSQR